MTLIESFPATEAVLEDRSTGTSGIRRSRRRGRHEQALAALPRQSIEDPLLIVQGANDPRVTKREADQMAIALRDRALKVRYILAPNEGPRILNADNRLALYRAMECFQGLPRGSRAGDRCSGDRAAHRAAHGQRRYAQARSARERANHDAAGQCGDFDRAPRADTATRRLVLVQGGQERDVGTLRSELTLADVGGRPALVRVQTLASPMLGTSADTVVIDRATLAPIRHRSVNMRRTMSLDFRNDSIVGSITPAGGTAEAIAARADTALFDSNTIDLILRSLPLVDGYAVRHPVYLTKAAAKSG